MISEIVLGMVLLVAFGCYRAVTSDGWDDSNILNWIRLFSLLCIHPEEFAGLYRLDDEELDVLAEAGLSPVEPFKFIKGDEFADNFPETRK